MYNEYVKKNKFNDIFIVQTDFKSNIQNQYILNNNTKKLLNFFKFMATHFYFLNNLFSFNNFFLYKTDHLSTNYCDFNFSMRLYFDILIPDRDF